MSADSIPGPGDAAGTGPGPAVAELRFACSHCGKELSAPPSAAGVTAPCPLCGVNTRAPDLPGGDTGSKADPKAAAQAQAGPAVPAPAVVETAGEAAQAGIPASPAANGTVAPVPAPEHSRAPGGVRRLDHTVTPRRRRQHRPGKGSMDPITGLSAGYEERKEMRTLIRIILAVALTLGITWGVFHFMNRSILGPAPKPAPKRFTSP